MFRALIIFSYFVKSLFIIVANSLGLFPTGVAPSAAIRSLTEGSLIAATISVFNFAMTFVGVPVGAKTPYQETRSNPGILSATGGNSGARDERFSEVMANPFKRYHGCMEALH